MINKADIVFGGSFGDEGKGKIVAALAKTGEYDFVCRWGGGSNAGHTIYINGKKHVTHLIPSGIFHGVKSVIGPGCVVNPEGFYRELAVLAQAGFDTSLVKVDPRAHVVKNEYLGDSINGSTGQGIAPTYAAKAARTGTRAAEVLDSRFVLPRGVEHHLDGNILCEGAQGIWLDVDYGNYPYVTSSSCAPAGALSLGIPPHKIDKIICVIKAYDTRVGEDPIYDARWKPNWGDTWATEIAALGNEFGATTGRPRRVRPLDLDAVYNNWCITGFTELVVNKYDILTQHKQNNRSSNSFRLIANSTMECFKTYEDWKTYITTFLTENGISCNIVFSGSPEHLVTEAAHCL